MRGTPARVCSKPECSARVTTSARCPAHPYVRVEDNSRPSAADRGYDRKWRLNSARFLAANPWCAGLPGDPCTARAKIADHIIPRRIWLLRGDPHPDSWEKLQPLCQTHHNRKTAIEKVRYPVFR